MNAAAETVSAGRDHKRNRLNVQHDREHCCHMRKPSFEGFSVTASQHARAHVHPASGYRVTFSGRANVRCLVVLPVTEHKGWGMGLFGNKKPKLPSYVGVGLDALLQDPEWAYAISQAGIDTKRCEIVLRLAEPTVGTGGLPENPKPAILFGQGNTLAIAYPAEREVKVLTRDKSRAQLQTQRSGWFQIVFGAADSLNGFMFWGYEDNLKLDTPEGDKFGKLMSAFLKDQLKPQQVVGTPQSLVSAGVSVEPPAPTFEDPEDALRWKMVYSVKAALEEMMDKYSQCFEKAEHVEKAFGMANAEFVNGVRQHELSRNSFRQHGIGAERELEGLLVGLREATAAAQNQWKNLVFLLPGSDHDIMKFANWCMSRGVDSEVMSSVASNAMFIYADYGLTRESFWTENERVIAATQGAGQ